MYDDNVIYMYFQEEVIFPEAGVNKNNEWRYIVQDNNNNNNFKQGIRVEKCS